MVVVVKTLRTIYRKERFTYTSKKRKMQAGLPLRNYKYREFPLWLSGKEPD